MYQIRPWLWVGKYSETTALDLLQTHGITAMLQLAEPILQPGMNSLYVQVEDGKTVLHDEFQQGIAFLKAQKAQGKVTLVACGAGISRSVIFAIAGLMAEEGRDLFDAYREVLRQHPDAQPHPELCKSLLSYHGISMETREIMAGILDVQMSMG